MTKAFKCMASCGKVSNNKLELNTQKWMLQKTSKKALKIKDRLSSDELELNTT